MRRLAQPLLQRLRQRLGLELDAGKRAERSDHRQDAGDVALVEGMHGDIAADQLGGDIGLQIGEGENEIGLEREDLLEIGGDERGHPRLLLAHPRRPHRVAGDADDAALLAEQIERLHGLFGEADDALGREHSITLVRKGGEHERAPSRRHRQGVLAAASIQALRAIPRHLRRNLSDCGPSLGAVTRPQSCRARAAARYCAVPQDGDSPSPVTERRPLVSKLTWISVLAALAAVPATAETAIPDLRGTWTGESESIVLGGANPHHATGTPAPEPRLSSIAFTMTIDKQDGRRFSGKFTSARTSDTIIAVLSRSGSIYMVDDDGYTVGTMLAPNRMELCYMHLAPATRVVSCTEMTKRP